MPLSDAALSLGTAPAALSRQHNPRRRRDTTTERRPPAAPRRTRRAQPRAQPGRRHAAANSRPTHKTKCSGRQQYIGEACRTVVSRQSEPRRGRGGAAHHPTHPGPMMRWPLGPGVAANRPIGPRGSRPVYGLSAAQLARLLDLQPADCRC